MVRRRRDQFDARRRVAQLGDVLGDLASGELAALAGLGALRDLDLQHLGARQVLGRDAEAARGHLLDLGLERIALAKTDLDLDAGLSQSALSRLSRLDRRVTPPVLAALPSVRLAAD